MNEIPVGDEQKPPSLFYSMREPVATITWCGLDVKQMYPEWTDEQCLEALDFVARDLEERSVEEGWNILDSLLQQYVKDED